MDKLGEELFDLAYQEGKSVQECLYDVYNKGRADAFEPIKTIIQVSEKMMWCADKTLEKIKEQLKSQN